jgi:hypothetical protein
LVMWIEIGIYEDSIPVSSFPYVDRCEGKRLLQMFLSCRG